MLGNMGDKEQEYRNAIESNNAPLLIELLDNGRKRKEEVDG